jgi:hypothetical protein
MDDHAARLAETQRLLDDMERLELRARLLLAEHRHVVATISDLQRQLEAAVPVAPVRASSASSSR